MKKYKMLKEERFNNGIIQRTEYPVGDGYEEHEIIEAMRLSLSTVLKSEYVKMVSFILTVYDEELDGYRIVYEIKENK